MALQVLNTDDEVTKELKETVIKIFVAAGVLETGFTKDSMAKYMLGMAQAGKLPGGPIVHLSEEEAIAFCHAQCDEMFQTLDGNSDGAVTTSEAFDFVLKQLLAGAGYGSLANVPTEMKMQALITIRTYGEMLSGAATSSGEDKLKKVKDKLKKSFDKCDVNGDGVLDREEMKAGCLVMAKSIAKMSGQPVDKILPNIERELDHFLDVTSPDGGKISFDAMLAVALPGLCEGEDPAEFFAKMDDCMFTTIDMNIDMYMGGLLKDGDLDGEDCDLEKVHDTPFYGMRFLCP
jgi:Ca2+-binding EF-hand superfamily protein